MPRRASIARDRLELGGEVTEHRADDGGVHGPLEVEEVDLLRRLVARRERELHVGELALDRAELELGTRPLVARRPGDLEELAQELEELAGVARRHRLRRAVPEPVHVHGLPVALPDLVEESARHLAHLLAAGAAVVALLGPRQEREQEVVAVLVAEVARHLEAVAEVRVQTHDRIDHDLVAPGPVAAPGPLHRHDDGVGRTLLLLAAGLATHLGLLLGQVARALAVVARLGLLSEDTGSALGAGGGDTACEVQDDLPAIGG